MAEIPELTPEHLENFVPGRFPHERAAADAIAMVERAVEDYRAGLVEKIETLQTEAEDAARNPGYIHARSDFYAQIAAYDKVLNLLDGESP